MIDKIEDFKTQKQARKNDIGYVWILWQTNSSML